MANARSPRPPQRFDARGGRLARRRLPRDRLARGQRLDAGQPRHPARGRGRHRRARLRPQPRRAKPGHPAERIDRRRHHRTDRPAVQRPVLPTPAARGQRVAVGPRHPARPPDARVPCRFPAHCRLPRRRPRRRRPAGEPSRRRPPPGQDRRRRRPDRRRRKATQGQRGELRRRRQSGRGAERRRPPDHGRPAGHRDHRGPERHGRRRPTGSRATATP